MRNRWGIAGTLLLMLTAGAPVMAAPERSFSREASYQACFTPGEDCEGLIVAAINDASSTIRMQAYSFTSAPIARAILDAGKRGVKIEAIVDKSQRSAKYTGATFLANAGIRVLVDTKPAIAHNKIILIDDETQRPVLVTGSFNFTRAAQDKNAENILMIRNDRALVSDYRLNFDRRKTVSVPYARLDRRK